MHTPQLDPAGQAALERVLGYLNFSSGKSDPQFMGAMDSLFATLSPLASKDDPPWRIWVRALEQGIQTLTGTTAAFGNTDQARRILELVKATGPAYLAFHRDLLFHHTEHTLMRPYFVGRVCEVILASGPAWEDTDDVVHKTIGQLNDYIGHRPVATLETHRHEPYPHEWVRPVPIYIAGAGASCGPEKEIVEQTLEILRTTDPEILRQACFDPELLDELAADPRAYDFDHPVNKRPNYHFGQWDPHHIDNKGHYRRFVVQQVTLDAILARIREFEDADPAEMKYEAAAVLAGTMLMAAGISGSGPDSHDSTTSLVSLLPVIAGYRDAFYEQLLEKIDGAHGKRLRQEAREKRQPFAAARQHLNACLARQRASQLEHVHLAKVFARLGYPDDAAEEAAVVPVAAARLLCQMDCLLAEGRQAVTRGDLPDALGRIEEIMKLIHRAINCGATVDPWNVLGFDAHFSLFPAMENSIRDHRVDELIELMEQVFSLQALIWSAASSSDDTAFADRVATQFHRTASWWHQFAAHEVSSVEAADPLELYHAAEHVAKALSLWHQAGAAAGDVAFWAPHVELFDSPKAYALVIDALLDGHDFVTSMALLVHWLGQAERIGLEQGGSSFMELSMRWLCQLDYEMEEEDVEQEQVEKQESQQAEVEQDEPTASPPAENSARPSSPAACWEMARKLLDYLEANAESLWQVPEFKLGELFKESGGETEGTLDEEDALFSAAYEDVVYRDSTDDGMDGPIFDSDNTTHDELEFETHRIEGRLGFITCIARLWRLAATVHSRHADDPQTARRVLLRWQEQMDTKRNQLMRLMEQVRRHRVAAASLDTESMVDYDRKRLIKESLLERVIATAVEMADANRLLLSATSRFVGEDQLLPEELDLDSGDLDQQKALLLSAAIVKGDVPRAREACADFLDSLKDQPLLYVPVGRGGEPTKIFAARVRQKTLQNLLAWLPRMGLLTETRELIEAARLMERENPAGPGAVTEFDDLFDVGYRGLVETLVETVERATNSAQKLPDGQASETVLVSLLETMTQSLIDSWLAHSRTLRLSVLEQVKEEKRWKQLVEFIRNYGRQIFTQRFLNIGNLRAILHKGVDAWLSELEEEGGPESDWQLLDDLETEIPRRRAVQLLTLTLEAVVENYGEYRDYNATTTQSDRGELLFTLLDFLRLRNEYDRIVWNLKPVALAHEVLVRRGHNQAAQLWRRAVSERFGSEADRFLEKLKVLQQKYAMQMPTVADRLAERFIQPMTIDRICALVKPALEEAGSEERSTAFSLLAQETRALAEEPSGVGLDAPSWLAALEDEVDAVARIDDQEEDYRQLQSIPPQVTLSLEEVQDILDQWTTAN